MFYMEIKATDGTALCAGNSGAATERKTAPACLLGGVLRSYAVNRRLRLEKPDDAASDRQRRRQRGVPGSIGLPAGFRVREAIGAYRNRWRKPLSVFGMRQQRVIRPGQNTCTSNAEKQETATHTLLLNELAGNGGYHISG